MDHTIFTTILIGCCSIWFIILRLIDRHFGVLDLSHIYVLIHTIPDAIYWRNEGYLKYVKKYQGEPKGRAGKWCAWISKFLAVVWSLLKVMVSKWDIKTISLYLGVVGFICWFAVRVSFLWFAVSLFSNKYVIRNDFANCWDWCFINGGMDFLFCTSFCQSLSPLCVLMDICK